MKTLNVDLDDDLINSIDLLAEELHTTSAQFAEDALQSALSKYVFVSSDDQQIFSEISDPVTQTEYALRAEEQKWS